jgi:hypothetical protein
MPRPPYSDISDILTQKVAGRQQHAAHGFSEKLDILDAMRARVGPLVHARKIRDCQAGNFAIGQDERARAAASHAARFLRGIPSHAALLTCSRAKPAAEA